MAVTKVFIKTNVEESSRPIWSEAGAKQKLLNHLRKEIDPPECSHKNGRINFDPTKGGN